MQGKEFPGSAAGMILLNDTNEIFLMRRSSNTRNDHNMWSIPGGRVEMNEKVEDAAKRETLEECGVTVEEVQHLGFVDHILNEYSQHWIPQIFLATKWTGDPMNCEKDKCEEVGWYALDHLPEDRSQVVTDAVQLLQCSIENK